MKKLMSGFAVLAFHVAPFALVAAGVSGILGPWYAALVVGGLWWVDLTLDDFVKGKLKK